MDILTELGVTASDAWANDAILWVEGPTEVGIFAALRKHKPELLDGIEVRQMAEKIRSARSRPSELDRLLELLEEAATAMLPFEVKATVLFDSDGLAPERQAEIKAKARIPIHYLPCREIENLLLSPEALAQLINIKRHDLGLDAVQDSEVAQHLESILANLDDTELYPTGPASVDKMAVKGSVALQKLLDAFEHLRYDKVADGAKLAGLILNQNPDQLIPLLAPMDALRKAGCRRSPSPDFSSREGESALTLDRPVDGRD